MGDADRPQGSAGAVSFLFTDIEQSSTWWDRDPAAMRVALELHDRILREVADSNGGQIFFSGGDGFGIAFSTATDAVCAARDGQVALAAAGWPEGTPLAVRMGVSTGVADERDGNYFGPAVNHAARVADAGHGGQVLISGVSAALLDPDTDLVDQGSFELKGFGEPERIWWLPVPEAHDGEFPPLRQTRSLKAQLPPLPTRLRFDGDVAFVGRERSVEQLVLGVQVARAGGSPVVLVSGEPGVGKTRLVAEACARLHARGVTVVYGRCTPNGGSPYQPFAEALSGLADTLDQPTVQAALAHHGGELVRLVPGLADIVPGLAAPVEGDGSGNQHRLFNAVSDAFAAVADLTSATVLVIDDFHWADPSTTALLDHLAGSAAPAGLAVVVVYRWTDVSRGTQVEAVLGELRRRSALTVQLDGLTLGEVEAYVTEAVGQQLELPVSVVADLYARTEGNPFFIRELVRHLIDTRTDSAADPARPANGVDIPRGVRDLVRERLSTLPVETIGFLEAAATFGQEFDVRFAARTLEVEVPEALTLLEPGIASGLVTEVGRGVFTFVHVLVRMTIYDDQPPGRRIECHVAAARAIEAVGNPDHHWSELSYHWGEAAVGGHVREAVASSVSAGEQAMGAAAHDAAIGYLRTALGYFEGGADVEGVDRIEVQLRLAEALNMSGRLDEAEAEFVQAADQARRAGRADLFASAALGLGGDLPATPPLNPGATALVEQALAMHDDKTPTRALLLCRLAERRHRDLPGADRLALVDEAIAIAESSNDDVLRARVMLSRVRALHGPDAMAEMLSISTEVDRIATLLPDDALAVRSAQVRMNACFVLGDLSGAVNAARVTSVLAARLRQPEYERLPLMWDAFRAMYEGRFEAASAICDELQDVLTSGRHSQMQALLAALLMPRVMFQGEPQAAYDICRDLDIPYCETLLARFSAEAGALDRAKHHIDRFGSPTSIERDANWGWWLGMTSMAIAASRCRDEAVLAEVRQAILPWASQHATAGQVTYLGSGHHSLGLVETALGNLDAGIDQLRQAIVAQESIGARPWVALSQIELAKALELRDAPGDASAAADTRSSVLAAAQRLGLRSVLARAKS